MYNNDILKFCDKVESKGNGMDSVIVVVLTLFLVYVNLTFEVGV